MKRLKNMERISGITLIALIITIIVLLLLASITVNLLIGDNGILNKAKYSKKEHEKAAIIEKVEMALSDYSMEKIKTQETPEIDDALQYLLENNIFEDIEIESNTGLIDDYEIILTKEYEEVIIESAEIMELKPKVTNLTITTDGTNKATKKSVAVGTPLMINFDHSIKNGTTTVDKQLPYTTDGIETEITFVITGIVDGKEYVREKKISIVDRYREAFIADQVQIGDFVNYSVGNWTQEDIDQIGSYYSGSAIPTTANMFGGFEVGVSKDSSINPSTSENNTYQEGWRVLSKNEDNTISIVHAGTPEIIYVPRSVHNANALQTVIKLLGNSIRKYTMYEDCSTNSVDTEYAIESSAHSITQAEALGITPQTSTVRAIGVRYIYNYKTKVGSPYYLLQGIQQTGGDGSVAYAVGMRPVVTLKSNIKVTAQEGQTTHTTPETAWILEIE